MSEKFDGQAILSLPLTENDSGAKTVRGYLVALLLELWREKEGFDGKRPFGNSGWEFDIYKPLIAAKIIKGALDNDAYILHVDSAAGDRAINAAICALIHE